MGSFELCPAENRALAATHLEAFPVNLQEIRRNVELILSDFGRYGFFDEYTIHDFSHCYEMIKLLDWIIPLDTQRIMSDADWLIIVLACYFHDLGLLITRDEFNKREFSDFPQFCRDKLFSGTQGADYRSKVDQLAPDDRERFLYQEFVRENHGPRIRAWIEGRTALELGYAAAAIQEIHSLLDKLPIQFKRDLALVCESHNLDDLDDMKKYRISEPYGNSDKETANLQYAAAILRTVDLLQITKHRAPTVLYRIINPTDPMSQREWLKQNAVTRVRSKIGLNKEGDADPAAPRDTIEIFAHFTNENGFFGLTSYLTYARQQLQRSNDVIEKTRRLKAAEHSFPWRNIDDDNVRAEGFLKETFGFEIDQARILDLLTGHTLYNDSAVVIRELVQNAIDAVRLQAFIDGNNSETFGQVQVAWNPTTATLEVIDNGTGMSQETIEKHLLKVGASRYQDPQFREKFPGFSSISRFGIGVLSTFMVGDTVEIITSSADEEPRRISLRSVHGKYLIRLLNRETDADAQRLFPHGTIVRLKLRASVKPVDVLEAMRRWIIIPRCKVSVVIADGEPVPIGFSSAKGALEDFLKTLATITQLAGDKIKVVEKRLDGCTLAYALRWSDLFRDWSFVLAPDTSFFLESGHPELLSSLCTCLEGIAVEFSTPGFTGNIIAALANATGPGSPKTNVARSSLEETKESEDLGRKIYALYIDQIRAEVDRLVDEEGYSLTWATGQIPFLTAPLVSRRHARPTRLDLQNQALTTLPMYLVEDGERRRSTSLKELIDLGEFWTVQSQLLSSAEHLVQQAPGEITIGALLKVCKKDASELPQGPLVWNLDDFSLGLQSITDNFEVKQIHVVSQDRRVDLHWGLLGERRRWISSNDIMKTIERMHGSLYRDIDDIMARLQPHRYRSVSDFYISIGEGIKQDGIKDLLGISAHDYIFFIDGQPIVRFLKDLCRDTSTYVACHVFCQILIVASELAADNPKLLVSTIEEFLRIVSDRFVKRDELVRQNEFVAAILQSKLRIFNPFAWSDRSLDV